MTNGILYIYFLNGNNGVLYTNENLLMFTLIVQCNDHNEDSVLEDIIVEFSALGSIGDWFFIKPSIKLLRMTKAFEEYG